LKFTAPPTNASVAPGEVPLGLTEECTFKLVRTRVRGQLAVTDLPDYLHEDSDGVIGWSPIARNIIKIDATGLKVTPLTRLPKKVATWTRLSLRTNSAILLLELSKGNKTNEILAVDTGDTKGVALHPQKWREWKTAHPNQPLTLNAYFTPSSGVVVSEEAWAEELSLMPLILTDVPVTEAFPTQVALGSPQFAASLGIAALKRLDFIVDGKHGMAYLRPKTTRPPAYEHNRLGAVFVPADSQGRNWVAQVLDGSPAYEAGVRNGDMLLSIQRFDGSHWRTEPDMQADREFRERPAGTKFDLTLKRGSETFKATVILRQILGPEHSNP
jgi:hypothetical protein